MVEAATDLAAAAEQEQRRGQVVGLHEDIARLRTLARPDDPAGLHEVHEPPRLGEADAELALQHRGGAELGPDDLLDRLAQQVEVVADVGVGLAARRAGRGDDVANASATFVMRSPTTDSAWLATSSSRYAGSSRRTAGSRTGDRRVGVDVGVGAKEPGTAPPAGATMQAVAAPRMTAKTRIFQLKVQLAEIRPPVWRRVLVPGEIDLGELHDVIQTAFGWTNSHLHEFEIGTARYGIPDPDWGNDVLDESRAKLFRLVGEGDRFEYVYDFGDNWVHRVTVEKVLDVDAGTRYPKCTAGRRACPPEDVGGPWGYAEFLQALADPEHEDHEQFSDWVGGRSVDPDAFDRTATDAALGAFAWGSSPPVPVR